MVNFADKTTAFSKGPVPISPETGSTLAHFDQLGRQYTYDPRAVRDCGQVCPTCRGVGDSCTDCAPSLGVQDFQVHPINRSTLAGPCEQLCTWPGDTFAYEMPTNNYFRSCGNYPTWQPYFPGQFRKKWRIDPVTGDMTFLPIDRDLCAQQMAAAQHPYNTRTQQPLVQGSIATPLPAPNPLAHTTRTSQSGRRDITRSGAQAAAVVDPPPPPSPPVRVVEQVVPGGQDLRRHWGVLDNRYPAQRRKKNIYIQPKKAQGTEPYTPSLYQTPYDSTPNLISTGKLVNSYLGQTFETFENQLPPPNTDKSRLRKQYEHINPKLMYLQGGVNNHNPPPRKKEQPGWVFNPVSARGGSNPFGSAVYDPEVRKQMAMYASRDIFNNQDGNQVVEPSLYGDKPHGYVGLVPRCRPTPFLPHTQELNLGGRVNVPLDQGTPLDKREEYTPEFFARKDPVLVSREIAPDCLLNGVEAVAQIPIASDQVGKFGMTQTYITPAFLENAAPHLVTDTSRKGRLTEGQTQRVGPAEVSTAGQSLSGSNQNLRPTLKNENGVYPVGPIHLDRAGQPLTASNQNLRPTLKNELGVYPVDTAHREDLGQSLAPLLATLRASLKPEGSSHPIEGVNLEALGQSLGPALATLRPTLKTQSTNPLSGISREDLGRNLGPILASLKPELKSLLMDQAFRTSGVQPEPKAGLVITDTELRETLKMAETLRTPSNPHLQRAGSALGGANQTLRPELKTGVVDQPYKSNPADAQTDGSYLFVDKCLQRTGRESMPVQNWQNAVDAGAMGDLVPSGQVSTQVLRGRSEMPYITQNSRVPSGIGGTSSRVISKFQQFKPRTQLMSVGNPTYSDTTARIIPATRLTERELQNTIDLALMGDDDCAVGL